MDLDFSDEQEMLRQTVRDICARYSAPEAVRELEGDPVGFSRDLWRELGNLDLIGLAIPESYGGSGQSAIETAIVFEELGRSLCMPPLLESLVGATAIERLGSDEQKQTWLPRIASGDAIITTAWTEPERGWGRDGVQATVTDGRLSGVKSRVAFASSADRLLVVARDGLHLVDPSDATLAQQQTMASDAAYLMTFDGAPAERVGGSWDDWLDIVDDALIAVAAWASGAAQRAHELAVEYAKERVQFDRPIGSFQGVAHPLADTATEIAGAGTLAYEAAWVRAQGLPLGPLAAMAKLFACDIFKRTTRVGQQIFGGIGFTLEIDMQLYYRRAKQLELTWLGHRDLEERIAAAELDGAEPFVSFEVGAGTPPS